jgi:hypothetical protein
MSRNGHVQAQRESCLPFSIFESNGIPSRKAKYGATHPTTAACGHISFLTVEVKHSLMTMLCSATDSKHHPTSLPEGAGRHSGVYDHCSR